MSDTTCPHFSDKTPMMNFSIDASSAGMRLDQYLASEAKKHPVFPSALSPSRSFITKQIDSQRVLINQRPAKKRELVQEGDIVSVLDLCDSASLEHRLVGESIALEILHEDEAIIVINKGAGMVVHPGAGNYSGTLVHALLGYSTCFHPDCFPSLPPLRPGIVHRLDAGTTGVMVVAKTPRAHAFLSEEFAQRRVGKEYLMLCGGARLEGDVEGLIGRDPKDRQKFILHRPDGRTSHTSFWLEKELTAPFQLTRAQLHTGRTHQIRVHAKAMQAPLLGDPLYGLPKRDQQLEKHYKIALKRTMLHAVNLTFTHPALHHTVSFTAPMHKDMLDVVERLESN